MVGSSPSRLRKTPWRPLHARLIPLRGEAVRSIDKDLGNALRQGLPLPPRQESYQDPPFKGVARYREGFTRGHFAFLCY